LIWAVYVMNYMGFLVWGHHMYLIGLDHRSRSLYSTITIMISMPAAIKVMNWIITITNGSLKINLLFWSFWSFLFFFIFGGITGMWLSHIGLNIAMHDTYYVVAHFHLMLSGAVMMSIFIGFYYYFSVFFQIKYSRFFAYMHIFFYSIGQWITFIPLFWVGFSGLPRRVNDYPSCYIGWQGVSTVGHFFSMIGVLSFYFMLLDSKIEKKNSLEISFLVPRLSKRCIYYCSKQIKQRIEFNCSNKVFIKLHHYL
jgi:cytochrome c oxidase subunit 1